MGKVEYSRISKYAKMSSTETIYHDHLNGYITITSDSEWLSIVYVVIDGYARVTTLYDLKRRRLRSPTDTDLSLITKCLCGLNDRIWGIYSSGAGVIREFTPDQDD